MSAVAARVAARHVSGAEGGSHVWPVARAFTGAPDALSPLAALPPYGGRTPAFDLS